MTPDQIATIRLLSLEGVGPARIAWLSQGRLAQEVLLAMLDGAPVGESEGPAGVRPETVQRWRSALRDHIQATSDDELVDAYGEAGVAVLDSTSASWPFRDDPEPPALLFARGDVGMLDRIGGEGATARTPTVAIVGSRRCTSVGRRVAERMGAELSALGVAVVSGLALGIDGEAHRGVFKAWERLGARTGGAIGVVASGLDVVYPKRHTDLWRRVGEEGLLVSEAPLGVAPARWRFPARNRLIAALADAVVVVESHEKGGALGTVDEAETRAVPVFAVPGSVLSSASDGTNQLLIDGATPVRDGADVIGSLGLVVVESETSKADSKRSPVQSALDLGVGVEEEVLAEVQAGSQTIELLAASRGLDPVSLIETVQRMAVAGLVVLDGNRVRLP